MINYHLLEPRHQEWSVDEEDEEERWWARLTVEGRVEIMNDAARKWDAQLTPLEREIGDCTILEITSWRKPARKLKPVGYWWTGTHSLLPHPKDHVDRSWNPKERKAVLKYLRSGRVKMRYMGHSHCRCGCTDLVPGTADMTDDVWVWPEGLEHYVVEHGVKLPAEFIEYVMDRS